MNKQPPEVSADFKQRLEGVTSYEVRRTENELFLHMVKGMRGGVTHVDKFVSWCLTGTGATFALIVANLDSLISFIGHENLRGALVLLAISFLCGICAKFRGILLHISISTDPVVDRIDAIKKDHATRTAELVQVATAYSVPLDTTFDALRVIRKVFGVFPRLAQPALNRILSRMLVDPLYPQRLMAGNLVAQSMWAGAQVIAIVSAMLLIAAGMKFS